ncbi:MAG: ABC transporter ATP-binding protein [Deltaproteobacteria bacterium]|nr:ABC transporter ATP-binding protein [Deltaproteobacteria bacterium]MBW2044346.1 ABC transporter ATP-binding protein [Deltaproteobacteria bacterium]MBW2301269.1 ABC transporter ATP-binding protein [Deltaproteobacteria bacterium]
MKALEIKNLYKYFGGIQAIHDLSMNLDEGIKKAIIGPNGAGKTTLFNIINGLLPATSGKISLFGRDITHMSIHQRTQLGLARSFQTTRLLFELSLLDNIMLAIQGTQSSRFGLFRPVMGYSHIVAKAQKLLELVDLWEKRNEMVLNIAHGEQRKMEIALSLASEPRLLLLDEPASGLTTSERAEIAQLILRLTENRTILIVDHDMDLVFNISDRILVLHYGKIISEGTPDEIRANERVMEIYLGGGED